MTLSLEQVARLQAEMDAGDSADLVLARAAIPRDQYLTDKEGHLRAIADEVRGGRRVLLSQYQKAFVAHRPVFEEAPQARVIAAAAPISPVSALPASPPFAAPTPPPFATPASPAPPPFAAPTPPPFATPPASAPPPFTPDSSDITLEPAPPQPRQPATPFVAAGSAVFRPAPPAPQIVAAPPIHAPVGKRGGMTIVAGDAPRGPATPFESSSASPAASRPLAMPASPPAFAPNAPINAAAVRRSGGNPASTMAIDGAELAAKIAAAVPFAAGKPTPAPFAAPSAGGARVETGTVMASGVSPTANPLAPEEIRRHASAAAELKLGREPKETVLARWGFTAATKAEADARWSPQFISDGNGRAMWMDIYRARMASG